MRQGPGFAAQYMHDPASLAAGPILGLELLADWYISTIKKKNN